jgi:hypothetical protein
MNGLPTLYYFAMQAAPERVYAVPFLSIAVSSVIGGVCAIIAGAKLLSTYKRGWLVIAAGVLHVVFVFPFAVFLLMSVAAGLLEIVAAIRLREHLRGVVFFALAGVMSIILFILVLGSSPFRFALNMLGGGLIGYGTLLLVCGLTMRPSRQKSVRSN